MIRSISTSVRHSFYLDPEISSVSDSSDRLSEIVCTFSSTEYGAFASSLPAELVEKSHFSLCGYENDATHTSLTSAKVSENSTVFSAEVADFWKLYQAYPKYLKALDKRKKRNNKKKQSSVCRS
jgi:hypothetical protein